MIIRAPATCSGLKSSPWDKVTKKLNSIVTLLIIATLDDVSKLRAPENIDSIK